MENVGGVTDVPQRKTKRQVQLAPNVLAIFARTFCDLLQELCIDVEEDNQILCHLSSYCLERN